ncbi:pseudouridine synthase [Spiroplasma endosymbiont of Aspidapion aeneum]|uniref:pseudouridine synthase n=1 Tax=Spiroplasma endosymbiont of Aspidapion aeneum TaxID=3066276 RepID=UPI00313B4CD3
MEQRLHKIIANRGYCSRRRAEELIVKGAVKVNGVIIRELGKCFDENCKIEIFNKIVDKKSENIYILFYKPRSVITTMFDPKSRKTVNDFFKSFHERIYPVGRLDYDVEGLLLMTNDGEFAQFISHPSYQIKKTYQALCEGRVRKDQVKNLSRGVKIHDNYLAKALDVKIKNYDDSKNESIISLTICEGKKHHVKEMLKNVDIVLKKLKRSAIEFLTDDGLKPGQYRSLKVHEVKQLYGIYKSIKK